MSKPPVELVFLTSFCLDPVALFTFCSGSGSGFGSGSAPALGPVLAPASALVPVLALVSALLWVRFWLWLRLWFRFCSGSGFSPVRRFPVSCVFSRYFLILSLAFTLSFGAF